MIVRYKGNVSRRDRTGAITLSDRPNLVMGGVGLVDEQEYARLRSMGVVLERINFDDLEKGELESLAGELGVDVEDAKTKAKIAKAIQDHLDQQDAGEEPATTTNQTSSSAGVSSPSAGATT